MRSARRSERSRTAILTFVLRAVRSPAWVRLRLQASITRHNEKEQYVVETNNTALPLSSAVRTGLEPATSGVTGRHSNRLNYRTRIPFGVALRSCFPIASAKLLLFFELCKFSGNFFQKKNYFPLGLLPRLLSPVLIIMLKTPHKFRNSS